MKITMEFITPDEESEFKMAVKGSDFFCALWDIKRQVRNHDEDDLPAEKCIDIIREIVYDIGLDEIE